MTFEDSDEDISYILTITYIDVVEILVSEEDEFGHPINEPIGKTFLEELQSFLHLFFGLRYQNLKGFFKIYKDFTSHVNEVFIKTTFYKNVRNHIFVPNRKPATTLG